MRSKSTSAKWIVVLLALSGCGAEQIVASAALEQIAPASEGRQTAATPENVTDTMPMDLETLDLLIREHATGVERQGGAWRFRVGDITMMCITDTNYDRMRIIAPVAETADMDESLRDAVLEANFHTALDARYATNDGVLYAAFIHPLSPLSRSEVESAIAQVASLVDTYGTSFTSGELTYGPR